MLEPDLDDPRLLILARLGPSSMGPAPGRSGPPLSRRASVHKNGVRVDNFNCRQTSPSGEGIRRPWGIVNLCGVAADGQIHLPVRGEGAFSAHPPLQTPVGGRVDVSFFRGPCKRGHNVRGPQSLTVAILAQGTHWAVAVTQALSVAGSIPTKNIFQSNL